MSDIPLLDEFISSNELDTGRKLSVSEFEAIVRDLSAVQATTKLLGSTSTALYAGKVNGVQSYQIANDLADRSGGKLRILDKTDIGKFLLHITDEAEIGKYVDLGSTALGDVSKSV